MSADGRSSEFWSTFFDDNERDYRRGGDKRALIRTIAICSRFNVKLPAWVREAIVEAWLSPPKSWDDVFGRPYAKGKKVAAERLRRRIGIAVIGRVKELNLHQPIDTALFEQVGKEFGVKASMVREIYYDEKILDCFELVNEPDKFYKRLNKLIKAARAKFPGILKIPENTSHR
jgi:hypothetical protein